MVVVPAVDIAEVESDIALQSAPPYDTQSNVHCQYDHDYISAPRCDHSLKLRCPQVHSTASQLSP